jgi:hypothetical protein
MAWQRVKSNAGSPGIDGMSVEAFPAFIREHWPRIRSALMNGTYRPAPVRRVFIPKPDGSQRPLGVPTVLDRVIQQALAQVLTPLFESGFSEHSYGFREGRNAHRAVRSVESCWKQGRRHAVDCDLKSYLVMVKSAKAAERVMESLTRFVEGRLKLVVNRAKSKAAPLKQCAFLGFQIGARGKAVWTAKAHARFKQRVKEITRRNRGHKVQEVIDELRRYVTGWLNYFGISHTYNQVVELAEWVRRRVRLYYWKQWRSELASNRPPVRVAATNGSGNQPRTRRRNLLALGIPREEVHMATRSRKGYWRMSANSIIQRALTNQWLHEQGVPDMRKTWIILHYGPDARI